MATTPLSVDMVAYAVPELRLVLDVTRPFKDSSVFRIFGSKLSPLIDTMHHFPADGVQEECPLDFGWISSKQKLNEKLQETANKWRDQ